MRARGTLAREPGDAPCGGLPSWQQMARLPASATVATVHRMHGHIQHIVMNRYATNAIEDNRDIRIKFMIGDFTDEVFKKKLQQREKARQKKTDIRQVLEMYQTVTIDLLQAFTTHRTPETVCEEFRRLRDHVNSEFKAISRRYTNCAVPLIQDNYSVY
jgi:threonine dehydrogenase-like Zn-dependent dehydrogenase